MFLLIFFYYRFFDFPSDVIVSSTFGSYSNSSFEASEDDILTLTIAKTVKDLDKYPTEVSYICYLFIEIYLHVLILTYFFFYISTRVLFLVLF